MDVRWLAYLGSGLVAVASLVPLATRSSESAHAPGDPAAKRAVERNRVLVDVERQTARLREYSALAPVPRRPGRNPFRFGVGRAERPSQRAGHSSRTSSLSSASPTFDNTPPPSPGSTLTLVGMAETRRGETTERTAIIAGDGDVHLVAVGDRINNRFTVVAIGADAVELRDDITWKTLRLALRQPLL